MAGGEKAGGVERGAGRSWLEKVGSEQRELKELAWESLKEREKREEKKEERTGELAKAQEVETKLREAQKTRRRRKGGRAQE